ncbi:MAG: hypothetical protein AB7S38_14855 [Vulcanimicrobiota bacterium]
MAEKSKKHAWQFRARFRRNAFGWQSQPAMKRVKEAVAEIKKVAKTDPLLAAEGAVLFIERVAPALERVDGSSGAMGSTVNGALATLSDIIAAAPADDKTRDQWLERLWEAYQEDEMPWVESLADHWGAMCANQKLAAEWADRLMPLVKLVWGPEKGAYFKGTSCCLNALLAAERYEELMELLEICPYKMWHYRQYGVKALAALGRKAEALRYAEASRDGYSPVLVDRACEELLLSSGLVEEAYQRYGLEANRAGTYLAWFRAVAKKYPHRSPEQILADLVEANPGDEGKWFAAAKDAKLFDQAIALAQSAPCAPQTLTRAARDFAEKRPDFALEAGLAALTWLAAGYGYEVTGEDVSLAYSYTMEAAGKAGRVQEVEERIRAILAREARGGLVQRFLGHKFPS